MTRSMWKVGALIVFVTAVTMGAWASRSLATVSAATAAATGSPGLVGAGHRRRHSPRRASPTS